MLRRQHKPKISAMTQPNKLKMHVRHKTRMNLQQTNDPTLMHKHPTRSQPAPRSSLFADVQKVVPHCPPAPKPAPPTIDLPSNESLRLVVDYGSVEDKRDYCRLCIQMYEINKRRTGEFTLDTFRERHIIRELKTIVRTCYEKKMDS
ncbi:hypothetical protein ElyMa_001471400 [Elysia marginata]|uniref:Uncharacterized protein n=1 Tax=Elysia marginata TaxID=1093978 RepID=A0AAV4J275_9GAST|nr:hypothetical protein ElyMa_001471400 [Elysia marginata]